ncbi:MAG: DUF1566 domain-containing protein [Pseudomonadales bacterium]|nr:DUF1566 domain-containing protein [Pseudomonadales bacterium]
MTHTKKLLTIFLSTLVLTACIEKPEPVEPETTWYLDFDGDTFGDPATAFAGDQPDASYVSNGDDCDDDNSAINPDASENNVSLTDFDCDGNATAEPYSEGDFGPAGGVVFYTSNNGINGLEVALRDVEISEGDSSKNTFIWGCDGSDLSGVINYKEDSYSDANTPLASTLDIGKGAVNTAAIIDQCNEVNTAAAVANAYRMNENSAYDDWFLPSIGELNALYKQKDTLEAIDGFSGFASSGVSSSDYWSSSEYRSTAAWFQNFNLSVSFGLFKVGTNRVRAVRAF